MTRRFALGTRRTPAVRRLLVGLLLGSALGLAACGGDAEQESDPDGVLSREQVTDALLQEGTAVSKAEVGPEDVPGFADERTDDGESKELLEAVVDAQWKRYAERR